MDSNYGKRVTLPISYFTNRPEAEQFIDEDMGRLAELVMRGTSPFRKGANILAQNWGSALTGQDMSERENQGQFLRWLSEGITPEEQQQITQNPYKEALKSGAGMAATLAPFASKSLRTAQFVADPLKNRLAQLLSQGGLEGGLGGFGYSREGKELQDTLMGAGLGMVGEVASDYVFNPSFRGMLNDQIKSQLPQYRNLPSGPAFKQAGTSMDNLLADQVDDVDIDVLRDNAFKASGIKDDASIMGKGAGIVHDNNYINDIELLAKGQEADAVRDYLVALRDRGLVDPGQVNMLLEHAYKVPPVKDIPINQDLTKIKDPYSKDYGEVTDNWADVKDYTEPSPRMVNTDAPDTDYIGASDDIKIIDSADYDDSLTSGGKIKLLKDDPIAKLEIEAKNYATPEEFVRETGYKTPIKNKDLEFREEMVSFSDGQSDLELGVYNKDNKIEGLLEYSDYEGVPYIKHIEVVPDSRGKGIGKDLIRKLQEDYPNSQIEWGMLTDKGAALKESLERELKDIWKRAHKNSKDPSLRSGFKEIIERARKEGIE